MIGLIQRVTCASVSVENEAIGEIGNGLLLFLGMEKEDTRQTADRMLGKVLAYRVFSDARGRMNQNLVDVSGGLLVVSQFTLAADTNKGLRPSFSSALPPEEAENMYRYFVDEAKRRHQPVASGRFGADMSVTLTNDGPVTFILRC